MTARLSERDRQRLTARGLRAMTPAAALAAMEQALNGGRSVVAVLAWERKTYRASLGETVPPFYTRIFASAGVAAAMEKEARTDLAALALPERTAAIERTIRETVAAILGFDSYLQVEREKGLFDLGIDSLTSVDVKNRLEKAFGQTLRTTIAFDYPTAASMAAHLAVALFPVASASAPAVATQAPRPANNGAALETLSAAELEALLADELKG
jgi:acyl carrier protein